MPSPGATAKLMMAEAQKDQARAALIRAHAASDAASQGGRGMPGMSDLDADMKSAQLRQINARAGLFNTQADVLHRTAYTSQPTPDMLSPELTKAIYGRLGLTPETGGSSVATIHGQAPRQLTPWSDAGQAPAASSFSASLPNLTRTLGTMFSGSSDPAAPLSVKPTTPDPNVRLGFAGGTSRVPAAPTRDVPATQQDAIDATQRNAIDAAKAGARMGAPVLMQAPTMLDKANEWAKSWGFAGGCSSVPAKRNFALGTPRVPGKGSPKVDTVPAQLAPGEAVLNAPAAEMAGRGLIEALNQIGRQQMGMV